ncbi:hypothetical protein F5148DRAFT_1279786 [Russula earlei]|uniref:Uncharacterized protein n=1 Tax=Russula earlei TaxID=71964 RepID=A0ACC0ULJ9_9AGAM|nr:hypothetical protein F5148DRAFT_1279786 [Russula earlei]
MPSGYHAAGNIDAYSSGEFFGYDTGSDELRSFPQPPTTCIDNAPRQTQPAQAGIVISSQNEDLAVHVPMGQFTSIDWQECSLPDGTRYYVNPTLHTITDVDLRNTERLNAVTRFLNGRNMEDVPPPEWELWLRDSCESTTVFIPHRTWVHHGSRMVLFERPGLRDVDKMESEYQYWLFMGSHPLHALLPSESVAKAIDVLTWFYTSPLILSSHNSASPFSQEECQELLTQLRSFSREPPHCDIWSPDVHYT